MEIIKQGDLSRITHKKQFECMACGCVFLADENEYIIADFSYDRKLYKCDCPCCNNKIYVEDEYVLL